ncbi:hypothetical protein V493_00621 [Pseudogymnoascus sp. VKM F-4281 (FW-2241)]|nr:hypothetical protein V493_00621 [Pseudogymnoascus sp. VKM F-4281 (FW-2241)]
MAGETGAISVSLPVAMTIAGFFAISCYNVIEINFSIFNTFKRRRGLYFWSMLVASWGIMIHAIASLLRFFSLAPNFPMCVVIVIGWYAMVTGQAVVMYSRLHLVVYNQKIIRWVLIMIITNFGILHIPVTILFFGSNLQDSKRFITPFNIYERIQLAGFFVQEFIISLLYIVEAIRVLRPVLAIKGPTERQVIRHLILVNIVIVVMDVTLLVTEYTNNFEIQTTYKTVVYSIKLKMEFEILNKLLCVIQSQNYCQPCLRNLPIEILPPPSVIRAHTLVSPSGVSDERSVEDAPQIRRDSRNGVPSRPIPLL